MKAVFIVCGASGCYSDRSEWNVRGFSTKEEAEAHRKLLTETVERHQSAIRNGDLGAYEREEELKKMEHLDPEARWKWDDIEYAIDEVPFGEGGEG